MLSFHSRVFKSNPPISLQNLLPFVQVLDDFTDYNANVLTSSSGDKADVFFSVRVFGLNEIDDEEGRVVLTLAVSLSWRDDRLKFLNLNPNRALNALSEAEKSVIWLPRVFFENKEPEQPELEDIVGAETSVMLLVDAALSPPSYLYIANVSEGADTPLVWSKEFK